LSSARRFWLMSVFTCTGRNRLTRIICAMPRDARRSAPTQNRLYDVQRFLNELRSRPDTTREGIARREYQALPHLDPLSARNLTLHTFMAENPNFFVDVLCEVYLPAIVTRIRMSSQAPRNVLECRPLTGSLSRAKAQSLSRRIENCPAVVVV
jgi:hypothetical protein